MSRSIISYDDITLPYDALDNAALLPTTSNNSNSAGHPPPSKKRKKNHNNQKGKQRNNNNWSNSWRDKEGSTSNSKSHHQHQRVHDNADEGEYGGEGQWGEEEEEESRELTHEEIWDDSALVDAWDAAMEEYEEYHGTDKDWKQEPVKKSALWYNVPMDPSKLSSNGGGSFLAAAASTDDTAPNEEEFEEDSKPLDFNTFVPTHDPTLDPSPPADYPPLPLPPPANYIGAPAPGDITTDYTTPGAAHIVSQDEAFQRALSAMYWGGYWTAMYHAQRHISQSNPTNPPTTSPAPAAAPSVQQVSAPTSVHVHADNIEEEEYIPEEEGEDSKIEIDPAEAEEDDEEEDDDLVSTQR